MNLKKMVLGTVLLGLTVMPLAVMAEGIGLNINLGGDPARDDQAHFDFNGGARHHDPMIWKAAKQLQAAKFSLWRARNDYRGHKVEAIGAINSALDSLSRCEAH